MDKVSWKVNFDCFDCSFSKSIQLSIIGRTKCGGIHKLLRIDSPLERHIVDDLIYK